MKPLNPYITMALILQGMALRLSILRSYAAVIDLILDIMCTATPCPKLHSTVTPCVECSPPPPSPSHPTLVQGSLCTSEKWSPYRAKYPPPSHSVEWSRVSLHNSVEWSLAHGTVAKHCPSIKLYSKLLDACCPGDVHNGDRSSLCTWNACMDSQRLASRARHIILAQLWAK